MLLALSWLKEFVPYTGSTKELADRLTMLGLEVEGIFNPFPGLDKVVVGKVLEREPHPGADKLSVCRVDVGQGEPVTIVCGAANVAAGQTVAVALPGAVLPGEKAIKAAAVRGVQSLGMICSESELGLADTSDGIVVLDDGLHAGADLACALRLEREVLEIGITPNRADCLSVLGLAREVALAFGLPLTMPSFEEHCAGEPAANMASIRISDPDLCPAYRAKLITGVTVKPSPAFIRYRLMASGVRPINNIVDVTNYILMELGQPLHAFDRERLSGTAIRVAPAGKPMEFTTLDGAKRSLEPTDILIWDEAEPIALAGVMGGEHSAVSDSTTDVVLECAIFRPASIRKTARRLGLSSEASYRYERGVDQVGSAYAGNRAAAMLAALSGGCLHQGCAEAEPKPFAPATLSFRPKRAAKILGVDLGADFCRKSLVGLGCGLTSLDGGERFEVVPPAHRHDLEREVDLIEEVARIHGMDRIEARLPKVAKRLGQAGGDPMHRLQERLRTWAVGARLIETVNYSFVAPKDVNVLGLADTPTVAVANPLSEDQAVMRPLILPGLLLAMRGNLSKGNASLRLFELAKAFSPDAASETTVAEDPRLGLLLTGARSPETFPNAREDADYADIKGLVEELLLFCGLGTAAFAVAPEHPFLAPGVKVTVGDAELGFIGRLRPEIASDYHAGRAVWAGELSLARLAELMAGKKPVIAGLPKFPPVRRDVTVVTPVGLTAAELMQAMTVAAPPSLEGVVLTDCYQAGGEPTRRLTFRLTYRDAARTLSDKEVDAGHKSVVTALTKNLPVEIG